MQAFPHHYQVVTVADNVATNVNLSSQGVEGLVAALRVLDKAERSCLITNSLSGTTHLNATIVRQ
jgi:hypothetical protein